MCSCRDRARRRRGADLGGANLGGANLRSADLGDADLGDAVTLSGLRPYFQVGPIGSRSDVLQAYITDRGIYLRAGCFFGARDEFVNKLATDHGYNEHAQEYRTALALVDKHAELWPAETKAEPS